MMAGSIMTEETIVANLVTKAIDFSNLAARGGDQPKLKDTHLYTTSALIFVTMCYADRALLIILQTIMWNSLSHLGEKV